MRLRFRIRTLMMAVAGVALLCACFEVLPDVVDVVIVLLVLSLFSIGPLIGATWTGLRYQPGRLDPITGGVLGGLVQLGLLIGLTIAFSSTNAFLFAPWLAGLVLHIFLGVFAGVLVSSCLLAFATPSRPADTSDPVVVSSEEEPAEFQEDDAIAFFQNWGRDCMETDDTEDPTPRKCRVAWVAEQPRRAR